MFKVGDRVRIKDDRGGGTLGDIGTIIDIEGSEYSSDKRYYILSGMIDNLHGLFGERLELVSSSPVRTRREIVPGIYGRLVVRNGSSERINIGLTNSAGLETYTTDISANEIREAIATLEQIAEVLEDAG